MSGFRNTFIFRSWMYAMNCSLQLCRTRWYLILGFARGAGCENLMKHSHLLPVGRQSSWWERLPCDGSTWLLSPVWLRARRGFLVSAPIQHCRCCLCRWGVQQVREERGSCGHTKSKMIKKGEKLTFTHITTVSVLMCFFVMCVSTCFLDLNLSC